MNTLVDSFLFVVGLPPSPLLIIRSRVLDDWTFFFWIHPPSELLPVLGPLERYMMPTLVVALLYSSRAGSDLGRSLDRFEELCILRQDSIHCSSVTLLMKQTLYHQATTAGLLNFFDVITLYQLYDICHSYNFVSLY